MRPDADRPGTPAAPAIVASPPGSAVAASIMRAYMTEVASRWYGRPATPSEVDRAFEEEPADDLDGDRGLLLLAMEDGRAVACAGVRFVDGGEAAAGETRPAVAELTKVFTLPEHRGRGIGGRLIRAAEDACRDRRITALRLDTRADLTEACALYERLGFMRVDPFSVEPYSDRWYAKRI